MAYPFLFSLNLGSSRTGLTLYAQLVDTAGDAVGGEIATGFVEFGSGLYQWSATAIPDDFRGSVKIFNDADDEFLGAGAVNPEVSEPRLTANEIAVEVLTLDISTIEATMPDDCIGSVVLATFHSSIENGIWTIYQTDGATEHMAPTVTSDVASEPITGVSS